MSDDFNLHSLLGETEYAVSKVLERPERELEVDETGLLEYVGPGIAVVSGLPDVQAEELLRFPGDKRGMAFNLDEDRIGVILLDENEGLSARQEVRRTGQVLSVPVGEEMIGRVVDALARPLDGKGEIAAEAMLPIERPAPPIMHRQAVNVPLQTGLKVVDALIPIGRGQRELILGDRQTGKTAIALDTIVNQKGKGVVCVYCAIGQRSASLAKVMADMERFGANEYSILLLTTEDDPPGLRYVAPYAAASIGEYFRDKGQDALVVFDDLTRHARAYREISLLLRRPPGREAYPGDIFYIHSRLLERSTRLRKEYGGGSLTALPIIETEAENLSAYIPTNLISITDGQIYLSPDLFQKGIMPGVDVGKSVSRVGGKTQLPAYRAIAGDLRLSYSQFQELESFSRFGTRLDPKTRQKLERGRRVREILKQNQYDPMPVPEQIISLFAASQGLLDDLPPEEIRAAEEKLRAMVREDLQDLSKRILDGEKLSDEDKNTMLAKIKEALPKPEPEPETSKDAEEEEEKGEEPEQEKANEKEEKEEVKDKEKKK